VAGGPADCDDGKLCTTDGCDPATGCTHTNNSSPCDDGDACTAGDICASGICVGGLPVECDDDNACTDDACDPTTGCTFTNNSEACNDNDACTTGDACSAGACQGGPPVDCDDGDVCTDDTCHDVVGCINTNNTAACEDGDACTVGDTCADGTCTAGAPADCDDDNVCTDDGCDSSTGCTHTPNAADCDDGDACTTSDACANGTCYAGMPVDCDDDNPCTDDDCDHTTGCTNTDKPEGSACDVNDRCVLEAECHGQVCTRTLWIICNDDDACTSDWCDPVTGDCGSEDISHECDDENGCTDDSCDPVEGCTNTNNTAACDDGDACTVGDACAEGACAGGAPADCDDGNVCTDNACDPATGCVNTPNEAACDDGDGCTVQDSCSQGTCMGGMPADCDDDNVCTDDGCDPAAGCTHTSNTATCDDGDACTTGDTCADGTCAGGTTIECDPNATCQGDSADHPCVCNEHFEGDGLVCTKSEEDLNVSVTGAGSDDKLEASEGDEEVPAVSTLLAAGPYQDIVVSGVSVSASGEGDDAADLKKVSLARVLEDGSYELLGWGTFSEDDGSLDFAGAPLLTVPAGDKTKLVVLYEFAGAGAGGGIVDTRAPSSTPGTPPVLPWLLFASLLFVFWAASRLPISSPAPAAVCVLLLATAALSCEREGMPWWPPDVADAAGTDLDGAGEDTGEAEDEGEAEDDPGSTGDAETVEEGRTFRATITAIDAKGSKSDEAIKIEGLPAAGPIIELR